MTEQNFTPVPSRKSRNGWSPARQWGFLQALEATASVREAARRVGMTEGSAYRLRRHPEAEDFRRAWAATQGRIWQRVEQVALERVVNGECETLERDGVVVAIRRRPCSDRLMIHMLQEQVRRLEADAARLAADNAAAAAAAAAARYRAGAGAGPGPTPPPPIDAARAETRALHDLNARTDSLPDSTGWDWMPHQLDADLHGPAPRLPMPERVLAPAALRLASAARPPRLRLPADPRKATQSPPGPGLSIRGEGFVPRPYNPGTEIGGGATAPDTGWAAAPDTG